MSPLARGWSRIGFFFSSSFLLSPFMLWALFWINLLGTVYGYMWYGSQLEWTAAHKPLWMTVLVPDSPTASLFFTLSLLYLIWDGKRAGNGRSISLTRSLVEVFGAVTSVKYGVWAVAMIFAGAAQGDALTWQDWMLSGSHLGMAAEAFLYVRFFRIRPVHLAVIAVWTFCNDLADYGFGIYPWLPDVLEDELGLIQAFTMVLSAASLASVYAVYLKFRSKPAV